MKTVFLLRHTESIKNTKNTFSTDDNLEALTLYGVKQAEKIAYSIKEYFKTHSINNYKVISADSLRSLQTGRIIAEVLKCDLTQTNNLCSFSFGTNAGKKEEEVETTQIEFYHDLTLYRKGIVNSYNIVYEGTKETLRDFELKVCNYIEDSINNCLDESGIVIVLHRSALTAYLIHIARKYLGYPNDFYGYIQLDLGNICVIKLKNHELDYIDVNMDPDLITRLN